MTKSRDWGWLVLALFFCSGATALVYEVVWSKFLSQMFGSTIQAQTVVLAVFMGGLALGNRIFGGRSDKLSEPVRVYGFVELTIGLYAFFFASLYGVADSLFVSIGSRILHHSFLLLGLKAVLSVALLLLPTLLMGGTLPLLAAWLQRSATDAGRRSARFYSVNSLGAVAGAGLAGFYLVQTWGMVATLQLTALTNVLIGGLAITLSRPATEIPMPTRSEQTPASIPEALRSVSRRAGIMVAFTGAVSMGLEVIASRSLVLIFGSSLQSFALVLMAFILGIGLGSAAIASPRLRNCQSEKWVIGLLLAAALWIGLLVFRIETWVEFYREARSGLARSTVGYTFHQILAVFFSMLVLGAPAAMLGAVLPLWIRVLSDEGDHLGRTVGRLLTWNTLGAVGGVLVTGFVLMPQFGLRPAFGILALGLCAAAFFSSWHRALKQHLVCSGAGFALILVLFLTGGDGWRHVMSSGVFRAKETEVDHSVFAARKQHIQILFYKDAPDATVTVERGDGIGAPAELGLRINGKAEASTRADLCTQLLVGHLPMLARPESKDVFILGLGSGITAGAVLAHPVERVTVAENCKPVIEAARFFNQWNRGALSDPRARIWSEDARTILKLLPQQYDVIITQPSNPWMAGVGSVFSREYYELAASRLREGGIMAQWFHLYDMHDGIVALVLRTFGTVFPNLEIWDSGSGDVVLLGSKQPWVCGTENMQKLWERQGVRKDFQTIGIQSAAAVLARQLASQRTAFAIAGEGPIQTDWFPILEYEAPRAFYVGLSSGMLSDFDERTWQLDLAPREKAQTLESLPDPVLRELFRAYSTINNDLSAHLVWRFRAMPGGKPNPAPDPAPSPCVFCQARPASEAEDVPEDASPEIKSLLLAQNWIRAKSGKRREGVDTINSLMRSYHPGSDWSRPHYGALAVRASIADGDIDKARGILQAALQSSPEDPQLRYLDRFLDRIERSRGVENGPKLSVR